MDGSTFDRVRVLVKERAAIVLEPGKEYLVETRLAPIARARGCSSVDELCRRIATDSGLVNEIIEAMTTNETSFFRDHHPFEALRQTILPEIIARKREKRRIDIWCAAASTGQEPYSIALIIQEHFPELASWDVRILGTDLSRAVLDRARAGRFTQLEVNRGMSASLLVKYFKRDGMDFQISESLRKMVRFEELNLIQHWPPLPFFDLVFIRNVLIYFDVPTKRTILGKVQRQVLPGGYLFLGGSETVPGDDLGFDRLPIARSGCYRTRGTQEERRHG